MKSEWTETPEQWAAVTAKEVWKAYPKGIVPAAINVHNHFTYLDENGEEAKWTGSHWTGHHKWAPYRGSALHQHKQLSAAFDSVVEPMVRKDQPEVFVNVCKPEDANTRGMYLFASNWTLPDEPELFTKRVPTGFFKSMVKPVVCRLAVKGDIGAVYDLIAGKEVEFKQQQGRIFFKAHLDSVEGRVCALFPEKVASAALLTPATAAAGAEVQARFELRGASGQSLGVLGSVRMRAFDEQGRQLFDWRRALPANGMLPVFALPHNAGSSVRLEVVDTITGRVAETTIAIEANRQAPAQQADPVTVYRAKRLQKFFNDHQTLKIVVDAGRISWDRQGVMSVTAPNADLARDKRWAGMLHKALQSQGIQSQVVTNEEVIAGRQWAHPWSGKMASARTRRTVPDFAIDGPVFFVGGIDSSPTLAVMERTLVAGRSLGRDNVGPGRAVLAWAPRGFSPNQGAVICAAADDAGINAVIKTLPPIMAGRVTDPYYTAREAVRFAWAPSEVVEWKQRKGLYQTPTQTASPGLQETIAEPGWDELATAMGTAIFAMDANANGVAVGTKSWAKPVGVIDSAGVIQDFWGGGAEVTPRDVGLSADGKTAWAGYSLLGRGTSYRQGTGREVDMKTPIAHKSNAFSWDSFKDSDRHIGMSPDGSIAIVIGGVQGIAAFDANTSKELWRIKGGATAERPRGSTHPEVAFSPDGALVLIAPTIDDGIIEVAYEVNRHGWDDKRGRYDKRKLEKTTVKARVQALRNTLMLVNARTGKPVWEKTTGYSLNDIETGVQIWRPGIEPKQMVAKDPRDGRRKTWTGSKDKPPTQANGSDLGIGKVEPLPFWHLYTTIGPQGQWVLAGTRDAKFSLLDAQGSILRTFDSKALPRELDPGDMIPPRVVASNDPKKVLTFAPQSKTAFLFTVEIGTAAQRAAAHQAQQENQQLMQTIRGVINDRHSYKSFGNKKYREDFNQKIIAVPAELRNKLVAQMGRVEAERRAGRKRDARWFKPIISRIESRLFQDDEALLDQAVGLVQQQRLQMPDLICDAEVNADLTTVYAGLFDQTVRAYDIDSGQELWSTPVVGGCQIETVQAADGRITAIYAGGTRGDVYQLDPASGKIIWQVNISDATNRLD